MKFLIQRTLNASVFIDDQVVGSIGKGYLVLIGICEGDTEETADKLIRKMINLRIFEDSEGKTNLSLKDVNGEILLVSQFTLYANCKKGNRPSFIEAAKPDISEPLYDYIVQSVKNEVDHVECGRFGADMKVSLVNDGPFTVMLDSKEL